MEGSNGKNLYYKTIAAGNLRKVWLMISHCLQTWTQLIPFARTTTDLPFFFVIIIDIIFRIMQLNPNQVRVKLGLGRFLY